MPVNSRKLDRRGWGREKKKGSIAQNKKVVNDEKKTVKVY